MCKQAEKVNAQLNRKLLGSSACLIWQILTMDKLPDAKAKGSVSSPGTELGSFCLLGKCKLHPSKLYEFLVVP